MSLKSFYENNKKYISFYLFAFIFVLSLIPLFVIARYDAACADDYNYSSYTHYLWENTHSVTEVINGSIFKTKDTYMNWQGSFMAVFIFTLQPGAFNEKFYCLVPVIMLGGLILSTLFFCYAFFGKLWGGGLKSLFTAIVWLFVDIQMLPSAVEGFYWYNGSSYYTFFFSLSLILFGSMILFTQTKSPVRWIYFFFTCIVSAVIGGGNYVTALITGLIFLLCIIGLIIRKKKIELLLILPFLIFLSAFFISIAAPGNSVRQEYYDSPGVWNAILDSFCYAYESITKEANLMLVPWIIFLFPVLWKISSDCDFSFRCPLLVLIFTFCLYAAQFSPPIYAMGDIIDEKRLENILFYSYIFFLIFNSFYIMGWCKKKFACKTFDSIMNGNYFPLLFLTVSFVFLTGYGFMPEKKITTMSAIYSLKEGEAETYYNEYNERLKVLKDDSVKDVVFSPYSKKPHLLYFDDVLDDANDWKNTSISGYYGKNTLVVK
ncbi:MAG: hypothetical protein J1F64_01065 [Oscillospiraceae bacterium]|nr:hypothetical protein [Oscillospiraceae bacterium]